MELRARRPPPQAIDDRASAAGLRTVAVFEAVKGVAVLLLGFGLLSLLHKDVEEVAERLLVHFHIDFGRRFSHAFLDLASHITDHRLWAVFASSLAYTAVRFTESWGLWHRRVWAEWFGILSGTLYLPYEIVKVIERPNILHIGIFVINLGIILYLAYIRLMASRPQ